MSLNRNILEISIGFDFIIRPKREREHDNRWTLDGFFYISFLRYKLQKEYITQKQVYRERLEKKILLVSEIIR